MVRHDGQIIDHTVSDGYVEYSVVADGKSIEIYNCEQHSIADLNGDCRVDAFDFAIFAREWLFAANQSD